MDDAASLLDRGLSIRSHPIDGKNSDSDENDVGFIAPSRAAGREAQTFVYTARVMSAEAGPLLPPPRMEPLRTVQEVMQWQPGVRPGDYFCSSSVELPRDAASVAAISVPGRPRLLVCHDMMGGYLGDALTQGCPDPDAYKVTAWALVDTFMYFSHHLCTIPPPGWTDAAHRHCTRVLGTFISEWDGGAAECARAFATAESAAALAEKLAEIAEYFGFDGWLVNIENALSEEGVRNMQVFLTRLTRLMKEVHPLGQVLWYDAVTVTGQLRWQDTLNDANRAFFDCCDGIFTNYTWRESTLDQLAEAMAEHPRAADVYVGVDVFGRNTSYQGGAESDQAVRAVVSRGLSCALFAPGWTHESAPMAGDPPQREWRARDATFWDRIRRCMRVPRTLACSLPFHTNFCRGGGRSWFDQGRKVRAMPWWCLSAQSPQPLCGGAAEATTWNAGTRHQQTVRAQLSDRVAFDGSDSLELSGVIPCGARVEFRLFTTGIALELDNAGLAASYTALLTASSDLWLTLWISFTDPVHPNTPPSASHPNGAGAALRQPHCLILRGEVADADGTFRGAVLGPDGEAPMLATTAERTVFAQSSQDECGAHESATAALSEALQRAAKAIRRGVAQSGSYMARARAAEARTGPGPTAWVRWRYVVSEMQLRAALAMPEEMPLSALSVTAVGVMCVPTALHPPGPGVSSLEPFAAFLRSLSLAPATPDLARGSPPAHASVAVTDPSCHAVSLVAAPGVAMPVRVEGGPETGAPCPECTLSLDLRWDLPDPETHPRLPGPDVLLTRVLVYLEGDPTQAKAAGAAPFSNGAKETSEIALGPASPTARPRSAAPTPASAPAPRTSDRPGSSAVASRLGPARSVAPATSVRAVHATPATDPLASHPEQGDHVFGRPRRRGYATGPRAQAHRPAMAGPDSPTAAPFSAPVPRFMLPTASALSKAGPAARMPSGIPPESLPRLRGASGATSSGRPSPARSRAGSQLRERSGPRARQDSPIVAALDLAGAPWASAPARALPMDGGQSQGSANEAARRAHAGAGAGADDVGDRVVQRQLLQEFLELERLTQAPKGAGTGAGEEASALRLRGGHRSEAGSSCAGSDAGEGQEAAASEYGPAPSSVAFKAVTSPGPSLAPSRPWVPSGNARSLRSNASAGAERAQGRPHPAAVYVVAPAASPPRPATPTREASRASLGTGTSAPAHVCGGAAYPVHECPACSANVSEHAVRPRGSVTESSVRPASPTHCEARAGRQGGAEGVGVRSWPRRTAEGAEAGSTNARRLTYTSALDRMVAGIAAVSQERDPGTAVREETGVGMICGAEGGEGGGAGVEGSWEVEGAPRGAERDGLPKISAGAMGVEGGVAVGGEGGSHTACEDASGAAHVRDTEARGGASVGAGRLPSLDPGEKGRPPIEPGELGSTGGVATEPGERLGQAHDGCVVASLHEEQSVERAGALLSRQEAGIGSHDSPAGARVEMEALAATVDGTTSAVAVMQPSVEAMTDAPSTVLIRDPVAAAAGTSGGDDVGSDALPEQGCELGADVGPEAGAAVEGVFGVVGVVMKGPGAVEDAIGEGAVVQGTLGEGAVVDHAGVVESDVAGEREEGLRGTAVIVEHPDAAYASTAEAPVGVTGVAGVASAPRDADVKSEGVAEARATTTGTPALVGGEDVTGLETPGQAGTAGVGGSGSGRAEERGGADGVAAEMVSERGAADKGPEGLDGQLQVEGQGRMESDAQRGSAVLDEGPQLATGSEDGVGPSHVTVSALEEGKVDVVAVTYWDPHCASQQTASVTMPVAPERKVQPTTDAADAVETGRDRGVGPAADKRDPRGQAQLDSTGPLGSSHAAGDAPAADTVCVTAVVTEPLPSGDAQTGPAGALSGVSGDGATVNAPVEGKGAHCAVHEPVAATAEGATLDASGGGTDEGVATHGAPDTLRPAAVADDCLPSHFATLDEAPSPSEEAGHRRSSPGGDGRVDAAPVAVLAVPAPPQHGAVTDALPIVGETLVGTPAQGEADPDVLPRDHVTPPSVALADLSRHSDLPGGAAEGAGVVALAAGDAFLADSQAGFVETANVPCATGTGNTDAALISSPAMGGQLASAEEHQPPSDAGEAQARLSTASGAASTQAEQASNNEGGDVDAGDAVEPHAQSDRGSLASDGGAIGLHASTAGLEMTHRQRSVPEPKTATLSSPRVAQSGPEEAVVGSESKSGCADSEVLPEPLLAATTRPQAAEGDAGRSAVIRRAPSHRASAGAVAGTSDVTGTGGADGVALGAGEEGTAPVGLAVRVAGERDVREGVAIGAAEDATASVGVAGPEAATTEKATERAGASVVVGSRQGAAIDTASEAPERCDQDDAAASACEVPGQPVGRAESLSAPQSRAEAVQTDVTPSAHGVAQTDAMPSAHWAAQTDATPSAHGVAQTNALPSMHGVAQTDAVPNVHGAAQTEAVPSAHSVAQTEAVPSAHGVAQTEQAIVPQEGAMPIAMSTTAEVVMQTPCGPKAHDHGIVTASRVTSVQTDGVASIHRSVQTDPITPSPPSLPVTADIPIRDAAGPLSAAYPSLSQSKQALPRPARSPAVATPAFASTRALSGVQRLRGGGQVGDDSVSGSQSGSPDAPDRAGQHEVRDMQARSGGPPVAIGPQQSSPGPVEAGLPSPTPADPPSTAQRSTGLPPRHDGIATGAGGVTGASGVVTGAGARSVVDSPDGWDGAAAAGSAQEEPRSHELEDARSIITEVPLARMPSMGASVAPSMQPRVSVGWTVATLSEISPPVGGTLRGAPVGPLDAWPLMRVQLSGTAEEEGGAPLPDAARVAAVEAGDGGRGSAAATSVGGYDPAASAVSWATRMDQGYVGDAAVLTAHALRTAAPSAAPSGALGAAVAALGPHSADPASGVPGEQEGDRDAGAGALPGDTPVGVGERDRAGGAGSEGASGALAGGNASAHDRIVQSIVDGVRRKRSSPTAGASQSRSSHSPGHGAAAGEGVGPDGLEVVDWALLQVGRAVDVDEEGSAGGGLSPEGIVRDAKGEKQVGPMELGDARRGGRGYSDRAQAARGEPERRGGRRGEGQALLAPPGVATAAAGDARAMEDSVRSAVPTADAGGPAATPRLPLPPGYDVAALEDLRDFEVAGEGGDEAEGNGDATPRSSSSAEPRSRVEAAAPVGERGMGPEWRMHLARLPGRPGTFGSTPAATLRSDGASGYPVGYLGASGAACAFRVGGLRVPRGTKAVVFVLQGVLSSGEVVPVSRSPRVRIVVGPGGSLRKLTSMAIAEPSRTAVLRN